MRLYAVELQQHRFYPADTRPTHFRHHRGSGLGQFGLSERVGFGRSRPGDFVFG